MAIARENKTQIRKSLVYKLWREAVFQETIIRALIVGLVAGTAMLSHWKLTTLCLMPNILLVGLMYLTGEPYVVHAI